MHKQVMTQHIFVSGSGGCGQLTIVCEELSSCKDELELQFMAKKLDKMDWFGSSDPFLQFSRSNESGKFAGNAPPPIIRSALDAPLFVYTKLYCTVYYSGHDCTVVA